MGTAAPLGRIAVIPTVAKTTHKHVEVVGVTPILPHPLLSMRLANNDRLCVSRTDSHRQRDSLGMKKRAFLAVSELQACKRVVFVDLRLLLTQRATDGVYDRCWVGVLASALSMRGRRSLIRRVLLTR